jgi:hypothetical protein
MVGSAATIGLAQTRAQAALHEEETDNFHTASGENSSAVRR